MQPKIRLMLVEDEAIVSAAICALLERVENITIVGKADTAASAVRKARALKPDVLLLDWHLPDRAGVEVITELVQQTPAVRIVILTAYAAAEEVVAAFRAGAIGYVLKTQGITALVRAVVHAAQGQAALPPTVAHIMLNQINRADKQTVNSPLTVTEQRVLALLAQGCANKEIARHFGIRCVTVNAHVSHILSKLNLTNRTQAALYALKQGWVALAAAKHKATVSPWRANAAGLNDSSPGAAPRQGKAHNAGPAKQVNRHSAILPHPQVHGQLMDRTPLLRDESSTCSSPSEQGKESVKPMRVVLAPTSARQPSASALGSLGH
jgi:two-component system nitrate/nitrite response regulator NarL